MDNGELFPSTAGTPEGGAISPLLANIALHGIERIGEFRSRGITYSKCVRYADDMVWVLKPKDDAEKILAQIKAFLATRGMKISQKKTQLTASIDGFDFLGWHFYVQKQNGKFKSTPSARLYPKSQNCLSCSCKNLAFKS